MKKLGISLIILTTVLVMFLTDCASKKSNPVSFVDDYSVTLTEEEGTTYAGDYFPIEEGYTCNYSGNANMDIRMEIPGSAPLEETTDAPALGMLKVLALCSIPLPSGAIPLYPIVDLTDMEGQIVADTSRFFMKDAQAVYIKALKMSDGSYMEVENPIYIKSELVVGDSWETAPKLDMTKLLANEMGETGNQANIDLKAKAKFFVVGNESISLPIGTRNAMRLEQANEIDMIGDMFIEGITVDVDITAELATIYHMIPDTGIVHQNVTGFLEMELSAGGQKITLTININQCDLKLTGLGEADYSYSNTNLEKATGQSLSFNSPFQEKLWKASKAITRILIKKLSL